jgi:hypothetical protein
MQQMDQIVSNYIRVHNNTDGKSIRW